MLPEIIIAVAGAVYLTKAINFESENLARISKENTPKNQFYLKTIGALGGLSAFVADVLLVAPNLQNPKTGEFDITGILATNFTAVIIITLAGALWMSVFYLFCRLKSKNNGF